MDKKTEALKLALEDLLLVWKDRPSITAIREALAEPQEKYVYGTPLLDAMTGKANEALDKMAENERELGIQMQPRCKTHPDAPHGFLRNASHSEGRYVCECEYWEPEQQPADEPVAYMSRNSHGGYSFCLSPQFFDNPEPLYTRPQPSAWVELTEQERNDLENYCEMIIGKAAFEAIEAKLKEKNV